MPLPEFRLHPSCVVCGTLQAEGLGPQRWVGKQGVAVPRGLEARGEWLQPVGHGWPTPGSLGAVIPCGLPGRLWTEYVS